jgi:hypothetical protein
MQVSHLAAVLLLELPDEPSMLGVGDMARGSTAFLFPTISNWLQRKHHHTITLHQQPNKEADTEDLEGCSRHQLTSRC